MMIGGTSFFMFFSHKGGSHQMKNFTKVLHAVPGKFCRIELAYFVEAVQKQVIKM